MVSHRPDHSENISSRARMPPSDGREFERTMARRAGDESPSLHAAPQPDIWTCLDMHNIF